MNCFFIILFHYKINMKTVMIDVYELYFYTGKKNASESLVWWYDDS